MGVKFKKMSHMKNNRDTYIKYKDRVIMCICIVELDRGRGKKSLTPNHMMWKV